MADALVFRFGREEVIYLMRALAIESLPGVDARRIGDLDEDHVALALAVADRSLRARGVVTWDSTEGRELHASVARALRASATPERTLVVELQVGQALPQIVVYAFAEPLIVEHSTPEPGVHQFTMYGAAEDVARRLRGVLGLDEALGSGGVTGRMSEHILARARQSPQMPTEQIAGILIASLPPEAAVALAGALAQPQRRARLALWSGKSASNVGAKPVAVLSVIQGMQSLWLIQSAQDDASLLDVSAVTAARVYAEVQVTLQRPVQSGQ